MVRAGWIFPLVLALSHAAAQEDVVGGKDNPYLSRMPNFYIEESGDREFDERGFFDGQKMVTVEGRLYSSVYALKEGAPKPSPLQIRRNYGNAIREMGGQVLFEGRCRACDDERSDAVMVTGKVAGNGRELWIEVVPKESGTGPYYLLTVLEVGPMKQEVTGSIAPTN
jgi:hypothetical protein